MNKVNNNLVIKQHRGSVLKNREDTGAFSLFVLGDNV